MNDVAFKKIRALISKPLISCNNLTKKNMRKFNHQHGAKIILFVFSINLSMHCAVKKLWKMMDHKSCLQQFDEVYFLRKFNHIDTN